MFTVLCWLLAAIFLINICILLVRWEDRKLQIVCCDDVRPLTAGLARAANVCRRTDYGVPETDYEKKIGDRCSSPMLKQHFKALSGILSTLYDTFNKKEKK